VFNTLPKSQQGRAKAGMQAIIRMAANRDEAKVAFAAFIGAY